jgi:hypothetical protein
MQMNGACMGLEAADTPDGATAEVLRLCEAFLMLNEERSRLDDQIMALSDRVEECEALWLRLDQVMREMTDLVSMLAATRSGRPAATRAKAAVLALLLQTPLADTPALTPEAAALALSLAREVANLT